MSLRAIAKKVLSSELTIVAIVVFKRIRSSISRVKPTLFNDDLDTCKSCNSQQFPE